MASVGRLDLSSFSPARSPTTQQPVDKDFDCPVGKWDARSHRLPTIRPGDASVQLHPTESGKWMMSPSKEDAGDAHHPLSDAGPTGGVHIEVDASVAGDEGSELTLQNSPPLHPGSAGEKSNGGSISGPDRPPRPAVVRNCGGSEEAHSNDPELWVHNGVELDLNAKYKV